MPTTLSPSLFLRFPLSLQHQSILPIGCYLFLVSSLSRSSFKIIEFNFNTLAHFVRLLVAFRFYQYPVYLLSSIRLCHLLIMITMKATVETLRINNAILIISSTVSIYYYCIFLIIITHTGTFTIT